MLGKSIYRGLFLWLSGFCILCVIWNPLIAEATEVKLHALSAVLMDASNGRVLYGKEENVKRAMASTTKIMTAILVLENCELEEEVLISKKASQCPEVKLYLKPGEIYTVRDLLYSMLLESHNDSAYALAEYVGNKTKETTVEDGLQVFLNMMNQKAIELGCGNTYFLTPNGLDSLNGEKSIEGEQHETTARELALIMKYCVFDSRAKDEFKKIATTPEYSFTGNNRKYTLHNKNALLNMMDGVLAGKTGFTGKAGYCYVCAVEYNGKKFLISLLGCGWPGNKSYKWKDVKTLLQYGNAAFENHSYQEYLLPAEQFPKVSVVNGVERRVLTMPGEDRKILAKETGLFGTTDKIQRTVAVKSSLDAPVSKGQKVGEIIYHIGNDVLFTESVLAAGEVKHRNIKWYFGQCLSHFLMWNLEDTVNIKNMTKNAIRTLRVAFFMVYYQRY